ncbi:aminodeoxychorismate lyase [Paenibacillus sp. sptzw28]|uniref:aminodeoxychorismate lyase n=1 Tax=Paenibacillus sp. sptzw28 TaxID=715179 RepID=UPI001C6F456D|nr:aminodeoxychorismate lyase [Paenibacillus sp. sptzw28]QYR21636.1 aminodeoxychorismate lyase [Paenibacillus sp. sptzw28]
MNVGWNGTVRPAEEAVISVFDHGFLYGMGLFETFRTYEGRPHLLERHLKRLSDGCRSLGIVYDADANAVRKWLSDLMEANDLNDAYVRLTVTAGVGELGLPSSDYTKPDSLLLVKPLPSPPARLYTEGRELVLLKTRRNTPEGEIRLKSLHYMNNIIAKRELLELAAAPGAEGLMLTREGWLAEGIVSNVFFAREGTIYTPSVATGILPGVTRARIIELAQAAGIEVQEGLYTWNDLITAEEVWVTNSIQELVPVTTLRNLEGNKLAVGGGTAGPVSKKLLAAYREEAVFGRDV